VDRIGATKTVDGILVESGYWKAEEAMEGNVKMDFRDIDCEYNDSWNCQKIMYFTTVGCGIAVLRKYECCFRMNTAETA
jgi:hypothetical protein